MFLASLLTGSLAAKLKSLAKHSAQLAWRTKLLFETNQELQKAGTQDEILSVTARQLLKIFQRDIVTYRSDQGQLDAPKIFPVDDAFSESKYSAASEHQAAQWVLTNNKRAGAGTGDVFGCVLHISGRPDRRTGIWGHRRRGLWRGDGFL